jgi:hypothetical protein
MAWRKTRTESAMDGLSGGQSDKEMVGFKPNKLCSIRRPNNAQ